jgi:hypothetical protein
MLQSNFLDVFAVVKFRFFSDLSGTKPVYFVVVSIRLIGTRVLQWFLRLFLEWNKINILETATIPTPKWRILHFFLCRVQISQRWEPDITLNSKSWEIWSSRLIFLETQEFWDVNLCRNVSSQHLEVTVNVPNIRIDPMPQHYILWNLRCRVNTIIIWLYSFKWDWAKWKPQVNVKIHFSLFHRAFLFTKLPSPTHALFYTILYSLLSYVKIP